MTCGKRIKVGHTHKQMVQISQKSFFSFLIVLASILPDIIIGREEGKSLHSPIFRLRVIRGSALTIKQPSLPTSIPLCRRRNNGPRLGEYIVTITITRGIKKDLRLLCKAYFFSDSFRVFYICTYAWPTYTDAKVVSSAIFAYYTRTFTCNTKSVVRMLSVQRFLPAFFFLSQESKKSIVISMLLRLRQQCSASFL